MSGVALAPSCQRRALGRALDGDHCAARGRRLCVHHRLGRTHLPGHRDIPDDQAHTGHNRPEQGPPPKDQLPHARLHDERHIHATTLLLSGVPVHVVAARLGHADPAITLRVYAHVIRTAETAAADIFAQAVNAT